MALLRAIDRALRVDEGERPQTIAEWRKILSNKTATPAYRRRKDTAKPTARPSSPPPQGRRESRLSKLLLAGVVVALVGSTVYWWRQNELLPDEHGSDVSSASGAPATDQQAAQKPGEVYLQEMESEQYPSLFDAFREPGPESEPKEEYFTRGSHEDEVLRLQGTPSSISRDKAKGYEFWKFIDSTVRIDPQTRRVLGWSNSDGNLKVRLLPGNQVTSEAYLTQGSHEDDVLRLQGTPLSIIRLSSDEIWTFEGSSVQIDLQTRRVLGWSNTNSSLNVRLLPSKQVTSETYFTRGSHKDDVLRLQGTPSAITWTPSGEFWKFEDSIVVIGSRTRRVLEWSNSGNLKVQL